MNRLVNCILLFSLAAAPGFATTFFQENVFAADDQVALFTITANSTELVTIQTYGYEGGTFDSTVIPAGGFAPTAFLFDGLGDVITLTNPPTCSQPDPTTDNCDDLYYQNTLGPGTYTLALAVYNNTPNGTSVSDGFVEDGNPGFTCQAAGVSGNFCDLTTIFGDSRTGNYAISITQSAIPEPGSMFLLLAGGALTVLARRSKLKSIFKSI